MPPDPTPGAQLTPESEQDWSLLCELIDFTETFALVFVFADDAWPARLLRERLVDRARDESWTLRQIIASDDTSLADALITLLGQPDPDAIVWLEAMGSTPARRDWWVEIALRLNERREVLRRGAARVLCLVAPTSAKPPIREAASDLWSITTLMLSARVEGRSHDMPLLPLDLDEPTEPATADRRAVVDDVVTQALALPSHAYRRTALLDAADTARSAGIKRPDLADALIAEFQKTVISPEATTDLREMVALRRAAAYLNHLERYPDAMRLAEASAKLAEHWVEPFSDEQLLALAASLSEWSDSLHGAGRGDDALTVALRQANVERRITHRAPADLAQFAWRLALLAERCTTAGRLSDAESVAREAVAIARSLTSGTPGVASLLVVRTLEALAGAFVASRRPDEAAEALDEIIERLRSPTLADKLDPSIRAPTLLRATELFALAGRWHDALSISDELHTNLGAAFAASHDPSDLVIFAVSVTLETSILWNMGRIGASTLRLRDALESAWAPFFERPDALRSGVDMLLEQAHLFAQRESMPFEVLTPLIKRFEALLPPPTASDPPV